MNLKFKDERFVFFILLIKDIVIPLKENSKMLVFPYIKKELNCF
jgi:hypothetical protein